MRRKSILFKTFMNLFVLMIILIVIIHISIFFMYKNIYVRNYSKEIDKSVKYVSELVKDSENYKKALKVYAENNKINICLKRAGQVQHYKGDPLLFDINDTRDDLLYINGIGGMDATLFRTKSIIMKSGEEVTVQVTMNLQHLKEARENALKLLPFSLMISLLFSATCAFLYSRKITKPVLQINEIVKEMTLLEKQAKIDINNDDEMGVLAANINELYMNLLKVIEDYKVTNEAVIHAERKRLDFYRAASHELKTPLAKLSVLIENMKYNIGIYKNHDKYLGQALDTVNELSVMIGDILNGVKSIDIGDAPTEPISIKDSLQVVVDNYLLIAKSRHLKLILKMDGDFKLNIVKSDMDTVLSNVVSNAVKYCSDKGKLAITLTDTELSIYNDASPISEERLKNIWRGEYVLKNDRNPVNSGLGLYIVKNILEKHDIKYRFIPQDKGYVFKVEK